MDTTPAYFATKYDSARDEVIALLSDEMDGYGMREDTSGDVDAPTGYFALVVIPDDVNLTVGETTGHAPYCAGVVANTYGVTPEDVAGVHIVSHNSQGFVSVTTYADEESARRDFDCAAMRYDVWSEDEWNDGADPLTDEDGRWLCPVEGHGYHSAETW